MPYKLDTDKQIFFYEQEFYCLSNFSSFRVKWRGLDFDTSEHAYHWEKFNDNCTSLIAPGLRDYIRLSRSAHAAFKFAQANKTERRPDWDFVKVETMYLILRAKLNQHEYIQTKLRQSGTRELIEDSWRDSFWGWGPDRQGQNHLGKLWMRLRDELYNLPHIQV